MSKRKISLKKNHHPLKEVKRLINKGSFLITERARGDAKTDFGWQVADIVDAFNKLPAKYAYNTEEYQGKPKVFMDYYRGKIKGENIFTHFYIENGRVIIDSFHDQYQKRKSNEMH